MAPSRSADGKTRLCSNSHQPWTGAVAWYEVHVHSEEGWDMYVGLFPGSPVVFNGHNRNLSWTSTNNHPDLVDVYVLETNPGNTAAAIGALTSQPGYRARYQGLPPSDVLETFTGVARALAKAHGRIDVPWSEVNRLRRGKLDLGVGGGPDILHAV